MIYYNYIHIFNLYMFLGERLKEEWNPVLLGTIHGVIGKTQTLPGL